MRRSTPVLEYRRQAMNVKRVGRLYVEQGLAMRRRPRKRLVRKQVIERRLTRANQEWRSNSSWMDRERQT
jgi:hypothetical protein